MKRAVGPEKGELYDFWRRFKKNKAALIGAAMTLLFFIVGLFAPFLAPYDANRISLSERLKPPSLKHLLGTDELGRDVFSRIIISARISLMIQLIAVSLALVAGLFLGSVSGFYGGIIDKIITGLMGILMAFPSIFLAIIIIAVIGTQLSNVIFAAAIYLIPQFALFTRALFMSMKEAEFIEAARAAGEKDWALITLYLFPNTFAPILVQTVMRLAMTLLTVSGLSYLGLGVQPPTPEWGAMLSMGRTYILTAPHVATFPGLAIMFVVLGFNLLGDGLRDALDPKLKD
jgi:peptide/nickel transport system permease protein